MIGAGEALPATAGMQLDVITKATPMQAHPQRSQSLNTTDSSMSFITQLTSTSKPGWLLAAYAVLTAVLCLPLLQTTYPPLTDYASHLARASILVDYGHSEFYRAHYNVAYKPIPNVAIDVIVPFFCRILGVFAAGKLFLLLIIVLHSTGCYLLSSAVGKDRTWLGLFIVPWIYNSLFLMGFVNYVFGVTVYLIALALWLRWRASWSPWRFLVVTSLTTVCYLSHLSAFAILVISIVTIYAVEYFPQRTGLHRIWIGLLVFLPAVTLYVMHMQSGGRVGDWKWNTLQAKGIALLTTVRTYNVQIDVIIFIVLAGCILYLLLKADAVRLDMPLVIAGAMLMLAFAVSPKELYTGSAVDSRFVWPAYVLLVLGCRVEIPFPRARLCLLAIAFLLLARVEIIQSYWRDLDVKAAHIVQLLDRVPPRAELYPSFNYEDGSSFDRTKLDNALQHMVSYAVIRREAYVPTVFAIPGQQPLEDKSTSFHIWTPSHTGVMCGYDYAWAYKPPRDLIEQLHKEAVLIDQIDDSSLWRLTSSHRH